MTWLDTNTNANIVAEGSPAATSGGITAAVDGKKDPIIYSLSADAFGALAIDPTTGVVTVANSALLDYEAAQSHSITVFATDGEYTSSQAFTVNISNSP